MGGRLTREEYENLTPYKKWAYRIQNGVPGAAPPLQNPSGLKVELPPAMQFLQQPAPDLLAPLKGRSLLTGRGTPSNPPTGTVASMADAFKAAPEQSKPDDIDRLVVDRIRDNFTPTTPAKGLSQSSQMMLQGDVDETRRYTEMTDDQRDAIFRALMDAQPEPTWKTPGEKLEDTHTSMQRSLSGRNTKARQNAGPEPLTSDEQRRVSSRLQGRGMVDELSPLNGRGGLYERLNQMKPTTGLSASGGTSLASALAARSKAFGDHSTDYGPELRGEQPDRDPIPGVSKDKEGRLRMDPAQLETRIARRAAGKQRRVEQVSAATDARDAARKGEGTLEDFLKGRGIDAGQSKAVRHFWLQGQNAREAERVRQQQMEAYHTAKLQREILKGSQGERAELMREYRAALERGDQATARQIALLLSTAQGG